MPETARRFQFELLRYFPNAVSGEFYNIGIFLFDDAGRVVGARFAEELRRLRCHPLAELDYLESLRGEFEEHRLLGEDFSEYLRELRKNLSETLQISPSKTVLAADSETEIERLYQTYVADPIAEKQGAEAEDAAPGTRRALRRRMEQTFQRYHLFANGNRLRRDARVSYGGARLQFTFDFSYPPNGTARYIHGIALRNDIDDATRLCFVRERLRSRGEDVAVTAVLDDETLADTRDLLAGSEIASWDASRLDELAMEIRRDLGL
jgi:hypothetical protein